MSQEKIMADIDVLLRDFTDSQSDVQGQILIAYPQGLPIGETWKGAVDPIMIGALSAAVKLTFQNLCKNLKKGNLKRLFMNSEKGRVIIQNAGDKAILSTIIDQEADIVRISFEMSNIAVRLEKLLKDFDYDKAFEV